MRYQNINNLGLFNNFNFRLFTEYFSQVLRYKNGRPHFGNKAHLILPNSWEAMLCLQDFNYSISSFLFTSWKVTHDNPSLEAVLVGKYLGVEIQGREEKMVAVAHKFANAIIGLSRNGLDRAMAAHALWERCAIPAILYCSEARVLSRES